MYMQEVLTRLDIEQTAASHFSDQFIGELADQSKTEGLVAR